MKQIIKIEKNDICDKIRYLIFIQHRGEGWKERYIEKRRKANMDYIDPSGLSNFEYFLKLFPEPVLEEFAILLDGKLAGSADINRDEENMCSITTEIYPEYRGKGLATELTNHVEKSLFNDKNVRGMIIIDYSENGESAKIAHRLGYEKKTDQERGIYYAKRNPNYGDMLDRKSQSDEERE